LGTIAFSPATKRDQQPFVFYHRDMADFNQHSSGVKQIPKITTTSKFCNFLVRNIFNILIPGALPYIFTGLRIAIGLVGDYCSRDCYVRHCWYWLFLSGKLIKITTSVKLSWLIYIGVVGLLLDNKFMAWIETRIVPQEQR